MKIIRGEQELLEDIEKIEILDGDVILVRVNADNIIKFKSHCNILILFYHKVLLLFCAHYY